jgi:hypothetical protein
VKKDMEMVMNLTNTLYEWWPLCVEYLALVKNHTACASLKNRTLVEVRTGKLLMCRSCSSIDGGCPYISLTRKEVNVLVDGQEWLNMLKMN